MAPSVRANQSTAPRSAPRSASRSTSVWYAGRGRDGRKGRRQYAPGMEFVESDDGPPFRRPPALDDRIWRHPSEMGPGAGAGRPRKSVPQRTVWIAVVVAAVGASVLSTGLLVAVGSVGQRDAV